MRAVPLHAHLRPQVANPEKLARKSKSAGKAGGSEKGKAADEGKAAQARRKAAKAKAKPNRAPAAQAKRGPHTRPGETFTDAIEGEGNAGARRKTNFIDDVLNGAAYVLEGVKEQAVYHDRLEAYLNATILFGIRGRVTLADPSGNQDRLQCVALCNTFIQTHGDCDCSVVSTTSGICIP